MFQGSIVAIVTPFSGGEVDERGLEKLVEMHINSGTNCILPCGTTGESATLSHQEHEKVIDLVIRQVEGQVPVVAGTGSNSTQEAIQLTRSALKAGADGSLQVAPYYNRPGQEGLYRHFMAIADAVPLPLVIYNIPSRTGVNIEVDTFVRLAGHENIVAVKEASGKIDMAARIIRETDLVVLAGDDSMTLPVMSLGGKGVVSVAANIVPRSMADLVDYIAEGNREEAQKLYYRLYPLFKALFVEVNPVPVKTALSFDGIISDEVRLPLAPLSPQNRAYLRDVTDEVGLEVRM